MKSSRNKGYGKLEVIISVMIIGVLVFLSIPIYNSWVSEDNKPSANPTSAPSNPTPLNPSTQTDSNGSDHRPRFYPNSNFNSGWLSTVEISGKKLLYLGLCVLSLFAVLAVLFYSFVGIFGDEGKEILKTQLVRI